MLNKQDPPQDPPLPHLLSTVNFLASQAPRNCSSSGFPFFPFTAATGPSENHPSNISDPQKTIHQVSPRDPSGVHLTQISQS